MILEFVKKYRICLIVAAIAVINLLVSFYVLDIPEFYDDTRSYIDTIRFIEGKEIIYGNSEKIIYTRILTAPMFLFNTIMVKNITGSYTSAMMVINIVFYFLIILFFYKLSYEIFKKELIAIFSTLLFFSNYCLYTFGTAYMSDLGGWLFFIISSYYAAKYFFNKNNRKYYYLAIFLSSFGVLFKEYALLGFISLFFVLLVEQINLKDKLKKIIKASLIFFIIPVIYHIFVFFKFNYTYFDWYSSNVDSYMVDSAKEGGRYSIFLISKILFWVFNIGWPLFVLGVWKVLTKLDKQRKKLIFLLLPASLTFLFWPSIDARMAYVFVPWLSLIAGYGLGGIKNKYYVFFLLLIYILVNYAINDIIKMVSLPI